MKRLTELPRGAWWTGLVLALAGMVGGCRAPAPVTLLGADDLALDAVWLALDHGDVASAAAAAAEVVDPVLAERARLDALALAAGRSAALADATRGAHPWLAARYLLSPERARARLAAVPSARRDTAWRLEDARLSSDPLRREALSRAILSDRWAAAEARALLAESLLMRGRLAEAEAVLEDAPPTARLLAARRRLDAGTGRILGAARGLLEDVRRGRATVGGLRTLERLLTHVPMADEERAALDALSTAPVARAARIEDARRRVLASLLVRAGRPRDGVAAWASLAVRDPVEDRLARRVLRRARVDGGASLEERVDADEARATGTTCLPLRLADEWALAARATYQEALQGESVDLDAFVARLDEAAAHLGPHAPRLASLPRRGFSVFGRMLVTDALSPVLPDAFLLAGQGLLQPAELTWYDRVSSTDVLAAVPPGDVPSAYRRVLVEDLRVPGFHASQGAEYAGAGLVDVVFLDLDGVRREARRAPRAATRMRPAPWPAHDRASRRALDEPLDVAEFLRAAVRADAGEHYASRVLETLALHEERHIVDVSRFLRRSAPGQLVDVLSAGWTPSAVRAEVERRAQLDAMRAASDPRLALAQVVDAATRPAPQGTQEHAAGFRQLLADFIEVLDDEAWTDARPLESLGLSREHVLVQQLDRLDAETVRAVALAVAM